METFTLYPDLSVPVIEYYPAKNKVTDAAVVIFPGGGYTMRAPHEGEGYAKFLNDFGMDAFVVEYRVHPDIFPKPLMDARAGVRFVRANAARFGIDPNKIAVMGSSAGGHLAALCSNYTTPIPEEAALPYSDVCPMPNATVLCYPVIALSDLAVTHVGSLFYLSGKQENFEIAAKLDPRYLVTEKTPPAFLWHTSNDAAVNVKNSLLYGAALREHGVPFEMHIFPDGPHGLGIAQDRPNVHAWTSLLKVWFGEIGFLPKN